MKKLKVLILLAALLLCLLLLASCRCEPAEYKWYLCGMRENVTFSSGETLHVACYGRADIAQPFVRSYSERCQIEFTHDGHVAVSLDEEKLSGIYTYKHNGFRDTSFSVQLDNGESFSGVAAHYLGNSELSFEFRGAEYKFSNRLNDSYTKGIDIQLLARNLRELETNEHYQSRGEIVCIDGNYRLICESGAEYLLSEALVWCGRLDQENTFTYIPTIESGECYLVTNEYANIKENGEWQTARILIIYYIEPLPDPSIEPERVEATLAQIYPHLLYEDIESAKITVDFNGLPAGYKRHHEYLLGDQISAFLDDVRELRLQEIYEDELESYFQNGDQCKRTTISVTVRDEMIALEITDGVIFDGERWWYLEYIPQINYDRAVQSFVVYNDEITVFDRDGVKIGVYSDRLSEIEFTVCRDDHGYMTTTPYLTILTEFGELKAYDAHHFWYKGQSYVAVGEHSFNFLFENN